MSDDFDAAGFKSVCALLGIETTTVRDAFGRTQVLIDRAGMEQLRDAAEAHGFGDLAAGVRTLLDRGPTYQGNSSGLPGRRGPVREEGDQE